MKVLPGPKAFRFMLQLKLANEALAFAHDEIKKAADAKLFVQEARWHELLANPVAAAEAWLSADRKDRAFVAYEQLGDWAKAAPLAEAIGELEKAEALYRKASDAASADRVAALPRVPKTSLKPAPAVDADGDEIDAPPATAAQAVAPVEAATPDAPTV
jgi:hypothetical protein